MSTIRKDIKGGKGVILSGNRKVCLFPWRNSGFKILIEDPFKKAHVNGLTPTEIKAGVVHPSATTYRIGNRVFADLLISREAVEALRDVLNESL